MPESADYDGAWKEALEHYVGPFLTLCFPGVAAGIDWRSPVEFLDKELQEVVRDAELGKQRVDKLVKVLRRDGNEEWVLVHVEVQDEPDLDLPRRMYRYHHRVSDRFGRAVASLAVLADATVGWRPGTYEESLWGCRLRFEYPTCKLLDLSAQELEADQSPAAVIIAAHRASQVERGAPGRKAAKWKITRRLYESRYTRQDILELWRLIDWMIALPEALAVEFRKELVEYEERKAMPYVTSIERLGREEGRQEGAVLARQKAVLDALEIRFSHLPEGLRESIETIQDESRLRSLLQAAIQAGSLQEFARTADMLKP